MAEAIAGLNFAEVAKGYRLIDQAAVQVLVPWADRWEEFLVLRAEAEETGISASWMHRAQGLAVSVYRPREGMPAWAIPAKLKRRGKCIGISDEWFILAGCYYDERLGLTPPEGPQIFIA